MEQTYWEPTYSEPSLKTYGKTLGKKKTKNYDKEKEGKSASSQQVIAYVPDNVRI